MGSVTTIALTGGPCGGKSTCLAVLEQELTNKGYKVFVIEEMATNLIKSGVNPNVISVREFQKMMIKLQYERHKAYEDMASKLANDNEKVILVYDRGIPDCKAFMSDNMYVEVLNELGLNENYVLSLYDAAFNLVTVADGVPEAYTCANNSARSETPEQAIERDRGCIRAWTGHTHLRVIDNKGRSLKQKVDKLLEEIYSLLGIPVPVEIERKYLIKMPDLAVLKSKYDCTTVDIIQTYLESYDKKAERRVRQRGVNGNYTFYYTEKRGISNISREEIEIKLSESEYLELLMDADTTLHQVKKTRTCFVSEGTYFELDIYPFWKDKAILEVELTNESSDVILPEYIDVIKEVTDDLNYKNVSLANNNGNI